MPWTHMLRRRFVGVSTWMVFELERCGTQDPSGYTWELTQKDDAVVEPFREISLRVSDLERSVKYYCEILGMRLVSRTSGGNFEQVGQPRLPCT